MTSSEASAHKDDGAVQFCVLACLITWALSAPGALCLMAHTPLPGPVVAGMGLSAFGPLIAALLTAAPRGRLRAIFQPWRAGPLAARALAAVPSPMRYVEPALER
jgi:hypothetical protein